MVYIYICLQFNMHEYTKIICLHIYVYIWYTLAYIMMGRYQNQRPNGILEPFMLKHLINKSWKRHMLENVQAIDNDLGCCLPKDFPTEGDVVVLNIPFMHLINHGALSLSLPEKKMYMYIYVYVICISYPGHIHMYNLLTYLKCPQLLITNTEHCPPNFFGVTSGNTNQESLLQKVSQLPVDFGHLFYWTLRNTCLWQEHHKSRQ